MRNIVLPRIVQGEEPYTLSMMLLEESCGQLQGWIFEILATDLNERSLVHAEQGLYGEYSTRNVPAYFRQKYFVSCGAGLQIKQECLPYTIFAVYWDLGCRSEPVGWSWRFRDLAGAGDLGLVPV